MTALLALLLAVTVAVSGTLAGSDMLPASHALPCPDGSGNTCGPQPTPDPGPTQGNQVPTTAPQAPQTTIPPNTDTGAPSAPTQGNGTFQGTVQAMPTPDNPNGCIVNCGPTQAQAPTQTQAPTTAQAPPTASGQSPASSTQGASTQPNSSEARSRESFQQAVKQLEDCLEEWQAQQLGVTGGGPGRVTPTFKLALPNNPAECGCDTDTSQFSTENPIPRSNAQEVAMRVNTRFKNSCGENGLYPSRTWTDKTYKSVMEQYDGGMVKGKDVRAYAERVLSKAMEEDRASCAAATRNKNAQCQNGKGGSKKEDCEGVVAVCTPKSAKYTGAEGVPNDHDDLPDVWSEQSYEQQLQVQKYIDIANLTITRTSPSGLLRTRVPKGFGSNEARLERRLNPSQYVGLAVGHAPDVTWGARALSLLYVPMDKSLNSSIGWQNTQYPYGYLATEFVWGRWVGGFGCVPDLRPYGTYGSL